MNEQQKQRRHEEIVRNIAEANCKMLDAIRRMESSNTRIRRTNWIMAAVLIINLLTCFRLKGWL